MKLLDYDPFTGLRTYFDHDSKTGKNHIRYEQDVQSILDANQREAHLLNRKGNWWTIGHVPNVVLLQWAQECGHPVYSKQWQEYAWKQLNKREYSKLNVNRIKL